VLTIVAMLGVAGFAVAATGTNHGTKVVPVGADVKAAKATLSQVADAPQGTATNSAPHSGITPLAPPANDDCTGATVIPSGSLPAVSAPVDITDATPQDVDEGVNACATTDRTVWFSFTPAVTGGYVISTCNGNGATGSTVYDTVLGLFESTGGACPQAAALGCNDTAGGCVANVPGAPYVDQSTVAAVLTAGTTYFIVAGHWSQDTGGVSPGFENIAVKVELSPAPANDTCGAGGSNATPLFLNRVVNGTTASATNDYRSDGTAACFSGVGQTPTSSAGLDVVFKFDPPANGLYSFRYVMDDSGAALRGQNPTLYLSHTCPAPAPGGPAVSRLARAFQVELPVRAIFEAPTIAALGERIGQMAMTPKATRGGITRRIQSTEAKELLGRLDQLSEAEIESLLRSTEGGRDPR
jgi:hypothetical protein